MSVSKFLSSGNLLFASSSTHHTTTLFLLPSFKSLQFHRRYCSFSALPSLSSHHPETLDSVHQQLHPWPEWVSFIDRLKTKGYFTSSSTITNDASYSLYKDFNQLKVPCLSFARDRYDLLKSLSVTDIQTLVATGCPNLIRKAVNSAKRLRAYLRLDEGDVCSGCNLRGSCDRAYVIVQDNEADARTVDIVRILLFYALDPLVISGEEKPLGREAVEEAARKLLSGLIELSETSPSPPVQMPVAKAVHQKEQEIKFADDKQLSDKLSQNVEMRRGDWMCPKCNFLNFSKNIRCLKCNEEGPKRVGVTDKEMKKGDWICSKCEFMNFSRNIRCLKCKAEGSKSVDVNDVQMKLGDWNCLQCGFMNFASNKTCLRCKELRPKRKLKWGEWECPSCDFLNFSKNAVCLKCKCERPKEAAAEYEQQIWKSPLVR